MLITDHFRLVYSQPGTSAQSRQCCLSVPNCNHVDDNNNRNCIGKGGRVVSGGVGNVQTIIINIHRVMARPGREIRLQPETGRDRESSNLLIRLLVGPIGSQLG